MSTSGTSSPRTQKQLPMANCQLPSLWTNISSQWNTFWFAQIPPHALAILRIFFGAFLIIEWLAYLPHVTALFSSQGIIVPAFGGTDIPLLHWFIEPFGPTLTYIVYFSYLLSLLLFTLGWDMRTQGISIAIYMLYYYQLSFHLFPSSYHRIFFFLVLVLTFSGADRVYSLQMKADKGSWRAWEPIPAWPQRLIAVQLTATYLGVGMQKVVLPGWTDGGEVLSYAFMDRWSTRFAFWFSRFNLPIIWYDIMSESVKILHGCLPIGLWIPWCQKWFMLAAAMFHILVTLFLGMWWFLAMLPAYIVFFNPEKVRIAVEGLLGK